MRFLITGGIGFIGSYIVEQLCKEHSVTVLDNHDTYGIMDKTEADNVRNT
jgi:nucleoside-diphosphate-sugar epimerase